MRIGISHLTNTRSVYGIYLFKDDDGNRVFGICYGTKGIGMFI